MKLNIFNDSNLTKHKGDSFLMINREDQARIKDVLDSKPRTNGSERCNGAENRTTCVY